MNYHRDWLIGTALIACCSKKICAYYMHAVIYVCSYWYVLINSVIIHTCAIYRIQITASLSDEDAVYLIESVVRGLHFCKRVQSPTVCEGLQLTREDRNNDSFAVW